MTETDVLSNQTNFFDQELLEQTLPAIPVEVDPQQTEKDLKKKKRQRQLIVIGTVLVSALFMGLAVLIVVAPESNSQPKITPPPTASSAPEQETGLAKRLDEVETNLRAADPVELNAPFPPVNFNLFLDAPPRR